MPSLASELPGGTAVTVLVELAVLLRGDDGNFIIKLALIINGNAALAVGERVAMKLLRVILAPGRQVSLSHDKVG